MDHPTQKPLSISNRIVKHFSSPGDIILVPFAGSGSECVASKAAGRHFVGFDLNADYIAIAQSRLNATVFGSSDTNLSTSQYLFEDEEPLPNEVLAP